MNSIDAIKIAIHQCVDTRDSKRLRSLRNELLSLYMVADERYWYLVRKDAHGGK